MKIDNVEIDYPIQILSQAEYERLQQLAKDGELNEAEIEERAKDIADIHMRENPKTVSIGLFDPYTTKVYHADEVFYSEYLEDDHDWYRPYNRSYSANFTQKTNEVVLQYVNDVAEPLKESMKRLWHERSQHLRCYRNFWRAVAIASMLLNILCGLALALP